MGYESYLVEIRISTGNKDRFVADLVKRHFSLIESNQNLYLEKKYSTGIVEINVTKTQVTFRYAKPNLKESLSDFLEELQILSQKYELVLYDFFSKKEYTREHFFDIIETFNICRNEFARHFSIDTYPLKSEDVFKNIK